MKLALVTGASSGIGAATARLLAGDGFRVVLVARSREKLDRVASEMGGRAVVEVCDATDGGAVLAMAERVVRDHGVPDVVVNAAGAGAWKRLEETPPSEAVEMMGAPYFAAFNVSHAFVTGMLERGSGALIHVGSPASIAPWPSTVGYAAARSALRGMNEALQPDLHGTGVRSCHVVFGRVDTAYFSTNENAMERVPGLGRLIRTLTADECAEVILRTIRRPRREVWHPFMLRMTVLTHHVVPGLTRWLLRRSGYRPDRS